MIKLDELKIFVAVAESGSFIGAAKRLDIAAPVVSRGIKNLESRLNTTLFNRTTRKILITDKGQWLLTQATKTFETIDDIQAHFMERTADPEGQLTVDAATPFALHMIAPAIAGFGERYPKIDITLECNETLSDLIDARVDVAIRIGRLKDSTLKAKKIGNTRRALFASPGYLKRHGTPRHARELKDHKCLGFSDFKALNSWPLKDENGTWISIAPAMRSNNGEALKQLALYDNGIICVSHFAVQKEVERGELIPLLASKICAHAIPVYAVYYAERAVSRHIRLFLDFLESDRFSLEP